MVVILTQTDTTVGFLSQDANRLKEIKNRPDSKPFIISFFDFKTAKKFVRVPQKHKNRVRRAKKTTFVVKNRAFRVAKPKCASSFFTKYKWYYTTSANEHKKSFEKDFAFEKADVVIQNSYGLQEDTPSSIIKLNIKKMYKMR